MADFDPGLFAFQAYLRSPHGRLRTELCWRRLRDLLDRHPALAGRRLRVLDAGCGTGAMAERLAPRGHELVLLDGSAALLEVARRAAGPAVQAVCCTLEEAPEDLGRFDLVLLHNVLEYAADREALLAALSHRMAPGGLASVVVLNSAHEPLRQLVRERDTQAALRALRERDVGSRFGHDRRGLAPGEPLPGFDLVSRAGIFVLADYLTLADPRAWSQAADLEHLVGGRPGFRDLARYHQLVLTQIMNPQPRSRQADPGSFMSS